MSLSPIHDVVKKTLGELDGPDRSFDARFSILTQGEIVS